MRNAVRGYEEEKYIPTVKDIIDLATLVAMVVVCGFVEGDGLSWCQGMMATFGIGAVVLWNNLKN